jgi:RNA polymerase sigma factor (sigma-70 family)
LPRQRYLARAKGFRENQENFCFEASFVVYQWEDPLVSDPSGNDVAANRLNLGRYRHIMLRWARNAGVAEADASDVVQEVMMKAVRHSEDLATLDQQRLPAYLKSAVRNQAVDANRRQKRAKRGNGNVCSLEQIAWATFGGSDGGEPVADDTSPSEAAEIRDLRERLLSQFPADEREIFRLAIWEELSPEQIASQLGISAVKVGQKTAAALLRLKRMLKRPK